jgi:hypothetical protein
MDNTRDLMDFGYVELKEAGLLLSTLKTENDKTKFLGKNVTIEFNPNSGNVFLVDEDFNVAMMNDDKLEDWFFCHYCGHEGFLENMEHEPKNEGCTDYLESIKL